MYNQTQLPLQQKQIEAVGNQMTTCRFVVKNGIAWRYGWNPKDLAAYLPRFPDVPNGTYEIQQGKVYKGLGLKCRQADRHHYTIRSHYKLLLQKKRRTRTKHIYIFIYIYIYNWIPQRMVI